MNSPKILFVDDDESLCTLLSMSLKDAGFSVSTVSNGSKALETMDSEIFDAVITDLRIDTVTGFDILKKAKETAPSTEIIMVTGHGSVEEAVSAMKQGAFNYINKPVDPDELILVIQKALENQRLTNEVKNLRSQLQTSLSLDNIIAISPKMRHVIEMVRRISDSDATVLIEGESGTGKEVIAKTIHNNSLKNSGPFIAINCGAMPENLLESELFGHVRGAFTGAASTKKGLFEEAHHGTLFLDEIGETSLNFQVKLLRVLQENEIRRVGDIKDIPINVRVLAASNRELKMLVQENLFRKDLYYRLRVIPIYLPPLRERREDILSLADFFLSRFAQKAGKQKLKITREAREKLEKYSWPGNVRELENTIERAMILSQDDVLQAHDILLDDFGTDSPNDSVDRCHMTLKEIEEQHIKMVLKDCSGHLTNTAKRLNIGYNTLWRRMKEYGISK